MNLLFYGLFREVYNMCIIALCLLMCGVMQLFILLLIFI